MTEVILPVMSEREARDITGRIKSMVGMIQTNIDALASLVNEARRGRAHESLGYASWTAYLADTMQVEGLKLDKPHRQEVVALLAGEGVSARAIAPIIGAHRATVDRDLAAGGANEPPAEVTGLDGKTYSRPAREPKPEPSDAERLEKFGDTMRRLVAQLSKIKAPDHEAAQKIEEAEEHLAKAAELLAAVAN